MTDKPSRNEDEYFVKADNELIKAQRARQAEEAASAERASHIMKCPKDGYDLVSSVSHGVTIETCPHCGGMWLDPGELQLLGAADRDPGLLGRVFGDVMTTLRGKGK